MKRVFCLLLTAIMLLSAAACIFQKQNGAEMDGSTDDNYSGMSTEKPKTVPPESEPDYTPTGDDLPMIETMTHVWHGYICVVPEGFETLVETDRVYQLIPVSVDTAPGLISLAYTLVDEELTRGWDDETSTKEHIASLTRWFDTDGALNGEYSMHSARSIAEGITCYHLSAKKNAGNTSEYLCVAKLQTNGNMGLVISGLAYDEKAFDIFDTIVLDLVTCQGDGLRPLKK